MRHRPLRRRARALALVACGLWPGPALAQTPDQPAVTSLTLFAGTPSGLWRSRDFGTSWERVTGKRVGGTSLEGLGPVLCIVPLGPQVYVAASSGVYLSEDFGESWKRVSQESGCQAILTSRYPQIDPTLFVGTADGLLRSRLDLLVQPQDTPRVFEPTKLQGAAVTHLEWPGPALIAGTSQGVFVSPDGGLAFNAASAGLPEGPTTALAISGYFGLDPSILVGVGRDGLYRTADAGAHWKPAGLAGRIVNQLVWLGPLLYAATDAGVFRSDDLGKIWSPLNEGVKDRQAGRLLFPLSPGSGLEVFLGTDIGVYFSSDGGLNWRRTGTELKEPVLALVTFPPPLPVSPRPR